MTKREQKPTKEQEEELEFLRENFRWRARRWGLTEREIEESIFVAEREPRS